MTTNQDVPTPALARISPSAALVRFFRKLPDPRRRHGQQHRLLDIVAIAICAVICGANDWHAVATFGRRRQAWLARFLKLPHGMPSHDTFERVFARLDPVAFHRCFQDWVGELAALLKCKQVAVDGKTLRGSTTAAGPLGPLHVVSAWAREHHLVLGQVAVDTKSNEITAIPKLLALLDLHGALVTIDALGCQTAIAQQIRDQGGDYLLTVKANQPTLQAEIQAAFEQAFETDYAGLDHDTYTRTEQAHGRQEKRTYTIITNPPAFPAQADWPGLRVIGLCYCERRRPGKKVEEELRYFIGSKPAKARYYGNALRGHWSIENNLHWQLDISFHEDDNRVCQRRAAETLAVIRRLALMLLKRHPDRQSIAGKRFTAALDTDFLEEVLCGKT